MARIGPSFSAELTAAGIPLDGIVWDGIAGDFTACPDEVRPQADAVLAAHDPSKPEGPPTVTGNQWAFALGDLGLSAAWRAAVARCKDKDQVRVGLIARDTLLIATDPLLLRIAAASRPSEGAAPAIDVAAVFAKATSEPL